jgi:hypothetical protein
MLNGTKSKPQLEREPKALEMIPAVKMKNEVPVKKSFYQSDFWAIRRFVSSEYGQQLVRNLAGVALWNRNGSVYTYPLNLLRTITMVRERSL